MCKRHLVCEGETDCIYVVNGQDMSAAGMADWNARNLPVEFTLSNVGDLVLAITEAAPTIPVMEASRIAVYLDSIGYAKAPF